MIPFREHSRNDSTMEMEKKLVVARVQEGVGGRWVSVKGAAW